MTFLHLVKKMKSEFVTPKDLEKLRVELASKAGGGKLDPTHPDMGPIMDSLIMTSQIFISFYSY